MSADFPYSVELYVNGWTDITSDLQDRGVLMIRNGRSSPSGRSQPCQCTTTLDNRAGKYSPLNPNSPYYGYLGLNTPLRVSRELVEAEFTATVSSAWPDATDLVDGSSLAWSTSGAGGVVAAGNYNSTGGKGTHLVPAADAYRMTYLATRSIRNVDVQVDCSVDVTNITGAPLSWNIILRGQDTSTYYRLGLVPQTDEGVLAAITDTDGTLLAIEPVIGITHSSSQVLTFRAQYEDQTIRLKAWVAGTPEPYDWAVDYFNDGVFEPSGESNPVNALPGWIGVQSRRDVGNTNANPTFSYDNFLVRSNRFSGEIPEWKPRRDVTGNDAYVPLVAAGLMRRIGAQDTPITSPLRAYMPIEGEPSFAPEGGYIINYWPLEEGSQSIYASPDVGPHIAVLRNNQKAQSEHWGRGVLQPWLYNVVALYGDGHLRGDIWQQNFVGTDGWRISMVVKSAGDQTWTWTVATTGFAWTVAFNPATKEATVTYPGGTQTNDITGFFDNSSHVIDFTAVQDGGNIDWVIVYDDSAVGGGATAGTLSGLTYWTIESAAVHEQPLAVGHVTVYKASYGSASFITQAMLGWPGEYAPDRMTRLFDAEGESMYVFGDPAYTQTVGPTSLSPLNSLVEEAAYLDQGFLYDARGSIGMAYKTVGMLCNQPSTVSLDFAATEFVLPYEPTFDDELVKNDVLASSSSGGSSRSTLASGPMSTAEPQNGGIGRYSAELTFNTATDVQLLDLAGWSVHQGTFTGMRYPALSVNLARGAVAAKRWDLLQVGVGDRVVGENMPADVGGRTDQLVIGYQETITRFMHELEVYGVQAGPYDVAEVDHDDRRIDAGDSWLATSIDTDDTAFTVSSLDGTRWTTESADWPVPVTIGGEDMLVGAVTDTVPAFVGAGTAVHADNASVTPTIHASATTGDLILIYAAIRNTAASVSLPAGYTSIRHDTNTRLIAKIHTGSESNPTVAFTGGSAGDTTSAQIAVFRNVGLALIDSAAQLNGSAQDIAYPTIDTPISNGLAVWWGWKQDDWTSVATLTGATEIGEPSSTTGNDQGLVWNYEIIVGDVNRALGAFTVTGGAAAVSKGGIAVFGNWQTFSSVTRSVNGIVKAHTASTTAEVSRVVCTNPAVVALTQA